MCAVGPFNIKPGQNEIGFAPIVERPQVNGWITRMRARCPMARSTRATSTSSTSNTSSAISRLDPPGACRRWSPPASRSPSAAASTTRKAIYHSITSCKAPCNRSTGIAYPIADGDVQFESGTLGTAVPPAAGALEWKTPEGLDPGTYTYFCRIHPFMRGAFRVKN